MPVEVGVRAIDMFMFLADGASTAEITFTGGEALLRFRDLESIVSHVRKTATEHDIACQFILKTNGTILSPQIVDFLSDGSWRVVVSIDGTPTSHDRHRKDKSGRPTQKTVAQNIAILLERGVECVASMTVHPDECPKVVSNVHELRQMGLSRIDLGPVYGTVRWSEAQSLQFADSLNEVAMVIRDEVARDSYLEIGPLYRESEHVGNALHDIWGCKAGTSHLAFLPDGSISGCSSLAMLIPQFPELVIGDVWKGFDDNALTHLQQLALAGQGSRIECQKCSTKDNCAGGCLAINYSTTRNPLQPPNFYCRTISVIPKAWNTAWTIEAHEWGQASEPTTEP
jgi:uncharacterized protein